MTLANMDGAPAERGTVRISATTRDHLLVTGWLVVSFKQFPGDEMLLYPMALYFAWIFIRDFESFFPILMRSWILFAFPVWCTLTVLWGPDKAAIIKATAQLFLTVLICYVAALRLDRRQILQSLLLAAGIYGLASLLLPSTGGIAARGVFASKNSMGLSMVLLWAVSLCVLFDPLQPKWLRIASAVLAAVAFKLVFQAQSATAVLLAFGVAALMVFGLLVRGRGLFHPLVLMVFFGFFSMISLALALVLAVHDVDLVGMVLDKFGKDATLTGRTVLWGYAFEQIREHPLLGVGEGGFWRPQDWTSLSRRIYIDFHKGFHSTFTFHNSYLQTAVHQGLIGLAIGVTGFLWAVYKVIVAALRNPTMPCIFFVLIAAVILARNNTEPGLLRPFSNFTMLLYMGALIAVRDTLPRIRPRAPASPLAAPPLRQP